MLAVPPVQLLPTSVLLKSSQSPTPRYPLIDGGIVANDPVLTAVIEAARLSDTNNPADKVILSLGSGINSKAYHYDIMRSRAAIRTVPYLLDMMMSSSSEVNNTSSNKFLKPTIVQNITSELTLQT
jgi:patatin-like phospholipase/acyl hydrolase